METPKYDILYIDDEENNLDGFKAAFRRIFKIALAISAKEGMSILIKHPDIPLVLSDQRMPQMTGVEFFKEISQKYPDAIRILITGYADLEATIEAINQGKIFYYISKPINPDEVKIILQRAHERYHLQIHNKKLTREKEELIIKAEREEKELIKAQLQNLRSQINPHFLFNSLNILRALINDNLKAREYVLKLSNVYRYLLQSTEEITTSLLDELNFLQEYIYLQKVRFTDGVEIKLHINDKYTNHRLPSYAMQILMENIFKHNAVSKDFPIEIDISVDTTQNLIISNTMNPKSNLFESLGTGQINLTERYSLLGDKKPKFMIESGHYKAIIPLLPPKKEDNDPDIITGR
jgi:sensor histidine kinase YesM